MSNVENDISKSEFIKLAETPKQRVEKELDDLKVKIIKLSDFLFGQTIIDADLTQDMIRLLDAQLIVMKSYASILQNRLAIWDRKDKCAFYHNFENRY